MPETRDKPAPRPTIRNTLRPEVAAKLAAVLEGMTTARGYLRNGDCYCILGALCETFHRDTGRGAWIPTGGGLFDFVLDDEARADAPPTEVLDWASEARSFGLIFDELDGKEIEADLLNDEMGWTLLMFRLVLIEGSR